MAGSWSKSWSWSIRINSFWALLVQHLAVLSLFINVIDLVWFNHDLRFYLKERVLCRCFEANLMSFEKTHFFTGKRKNRTFTPDYSDNDGGDGANGNTDESVLVLLLLMIMIDVGALRDLHSSEHDRVHRTEVLSIISFTTPKETTQRRRLPVKTRGTILRSSRPPMADGIQFLIIINQIILLTIILLCGLYILTIVVNSRFHTATNILTGNVCLASIVCCLFWLVFNTLTTFYPYALTQSYGGCIVDKCLGDFVNCLIIYSLAVITVNRFLLLTYPNKPIFKRKIHSWFSSLIQWTLVLLLCIPQLVAAVSVNIIERALCILLSFS